MRRTVVLTSAPTVLRTGTGRVVARCATQVSGRSSSNVVPPSSGTLVAGSITVAGPRGRATPQVVLRSVRLGQAAVRVLVVSSPSHGVVGCAKAVTRLAFPRAGVPLGRGSGSSARRVASVLAATPAGVKASTCRGPRASTWAIALGGVAAAVGGGTQATALAVATSASSTSGPPSRLGIAAACLARLG